MLEEIRWQKDCLSQELKICIGKKVLIFVSKILFHSIIEFFVLNRILSDLAILYRFVLQNVKTKYYPTLVGIEPGPLDSKPACSPYPNWALACKTETLGSLYSHTLLILT